VVNTRTRLRAVHARGGWAGVLSTACESPTTSAPWFVRRHTQMVLRQHRALLCPRGLPAFLPVPLWSFARAPRPLDPKPLRFPAFPRQLLPGRPRGQFLQGCALLNSPPILVLLPLSKRQGHALRGAYGPP